MPLVEVIHAAEEAATVEQKQALVRDIQRIFGEVLGTAPRALRIVFYPLSSEDSSDGLLDNDGDFVNRS